MKLFFIIFLIMIVGFLVTPAFADDKIGGEGYGEKALLLELEIFNLLLFSFLVILIISVIRKKQLYKINPSWIYFLFGVILYGMTRIFYITSDSGIINISDDSLEVFWHLIFYNSLILFLFSIKNIMSKPNFVEQKSLKYCVSVCIVSLFLATLMFIIAESIDEQFNSIFSDTYWATIGIQHLIAFTFASIVGFTLIEIRFFPERYNQKFLLPLVMVFIIFVSYHVWEMLTESLEVIILPETTIEQVEQILVVPIFIFFIIGILRVRKSIREVQQ